MRHGIVATRLTCFALISAIEADLRQAISGVPNRMARASLLPPDVQKSAMRRWEEDHKVREGGSSENDADLLEYTDFADLGKILYGIDDEFGKLEKQPVRGIAAKLIELAPARNRVCHSRPLEPDDFAELFDFAKELTTRHKSLGWREIDATLARLQSDPSFVLHLVIPAFWSADVSPIPHNLPLPEFDDTGFLGRVADRREVCRLLLSPHPVVTIVGEGGAGKTALALRCLYDLLELKEGCKYDAIIWTSLKVRVLTPQGIQEIKDSVASTLGLVQSVASALGTLSASRADATALIDEIRQYMGHLRILLAIDNFETLTSGSSLRPLLSSVPTGSKVLLTSRVGMGELEVRYPISGLDDKTAMSLARRFAKTLNLQLISELREETLKKYCNWLHNSPLLVRWFVSSIAAGADPKHLIGPGARGFEDALKFCFENLFDRLSDAEREILHILASAKRPLTQSELYFLTKDKKRDEVDWALNKLHHSSMLKRLFDSGMKSDEPMLTYYMTEFASEYVGKFAPPSSVLFKSVQDSLKQLRHMQESSAAQRAWHKYEIYAIRAETRDQLISAAYLRRALAASRARQIEDARKLMEEAKALLPTYSEAYRLAGLIEADAGELYKASEEFETAVRLDPDSAIVRYTYAWVLLTRFSDNEAALAQLESALSLDPDEPTLRSTKALALTRLGRCQEGAHLYESLLTEVDKRGQQRRLETRDQAAECYRRWAEQDFRTRDYSASETHLERSMEILEEAMHAKDYDESLVRRFLRVTDEGMLYAASRGSAEFAARLLKTLSANQAFYTGQNPTFRNLDPLREAFRGNESILTLMDELPIQGSTSRDSIKVSEQPPNTASAFATTGPGPANGRIKRLLVERDFGFIEDDSGKEWFFHRNDLRKKALWPRLNRGQKVLFRIGKNQSGACAVDVIVTGDNL
jgi:LuxR family glucitol operon transcriptional activator